MSFLRYFNDHVAKIKFVYKPGSILMKLINFFLAITNFFGFTNIKGFLTNYGTTLGRTIYDSPAWNWDDPLTAHMLHELTHVAQRGILYSLRYAFSQTWRAHYESVCIQTEWIVYPANRTPERTSNRAIKLTGYGIDLDVAMNALKDRSRELDQDKPQKAALIVTEALKEWEHERGLR